MERRDTEEVGEGFEGEVASDLENEFVWECKQWTNSEVVKQWGEENAQKTTGEEETEERFGSEFFGDLEKDLVREEKEWHGREPLIAWTRSRRATGIIGMNSSDEFAGLSDGGGMRE